MTNFVINQHWNYTTILDDFRIAEPLSAVYYLTEEELKPFQGELSQGNWVLEIADQRQGNTNPAPRLINWFLQIEPAPAPQPIPLTNKVVFRDVMQAGETKYFIVNVPCEVTNVSATLGSSGAGSTMYYRRSGIPNINGGIGDGYDLGPAKSYRLLVDTNQPDVSIESCKPFYLAVRNDSDSRERISVNINFENLRILTLRPARATYFRANSDSVNNPNSRGVTNIVLPGFTNMHFYCFNVDADTNTSEIGRAHV